MNDKPVLSKDIRQAFLDFFEKRGHKVVDGSPLLPPANDKTLLFTNAGMNQFKDVLLGYEQRDYKRAASCQVCMRAGGKHNDLDAVGKDGRHHTLFEMLGNWSFGDFWKRDALAWAWEFVTEVLKIPTERLYVSIYKTDEEAYDIWTKVVGLDPSRVVRLGDIEKGDEENFWSMGPTGPCGPCSEIYYDLGPDVGCKKPSCFVGCDCDRYFEIWNVVFMESNRLEDGSFVPLAMQSIDTGMGLERAVAIQQGVISNFDTDLFLPIIDAIKKLAKKHRENPTLDKESYCVIADHIRSLTFTMAEGAIFSNEGRGYVLRRILRRASRHGHLLGLDEPFLYKLVDTVIAKMGEIYPHIIHMRDRVMREIREEEERFVSTLERGLLYFEDSIKTTVENKHQELSGEQVFRLYDTFGLPPDLTEIMANERGFKISWHEFEKLLEEQRERSRKTAKFYDQGDEDVPWVEVHGGEGTEFVGYDELKTETIIRRYRLFKDRAELVVAKNPIYVEKGGQQSDKGMITICGKEIEILGASEQGSRVILQCELFSDNGLDMKKSVAIETKQDLRCDISRNHTATHLLHKALRAHLGERATQAGSYLDTEKLTFDFRYDKGLTASEISNIESMVNQMIIENFCVNTQIMSQDEAVKQGAMALFGDKYGDEVRMVNIGEGISKELCGGTHVGSTGQIGMFVIESEKSVAAGVRRITAFTGKAAVQYVHKLKNCVDMLKDELATPLEDMPEKVKKVVAENVSLSKEIAKLRKDKAAGELLAKGPQENDCFIDVLSGYSREELMDISDKVAEKFASSIIFLASVGEGKTILSLRVPEILVKAGQNAGKLLSQAAAVLGGKGGGRPGIATGGVDHEVTLEELKKAL